MIPGSTGTVNPSLTITALAERSLAEILRAGQSPALAPARSDTARGVTFSDS